MACLQDLIQITRVDEDLEIAKYGSFQVHSGMQELSIKFKTESREHTESSVEIMYWP